ncbi:C-type lectin [Aphelenchoides avenae]|nr:C-type lectin [Aphelenchus avenae]
MSVLVGVLLAIVNGSCGSGWTYKPNANRCFKLVNERLSWDEAQTTCVSMGATLAKIRNEAVEAEVQDVAAPGDLQFLVGLRYDQAKREWLWRDGSKADYYNWEYGLWENGGQWGECVIASLDPKFGASGRWYNVDCAYYPRSFVCEKAA